MEHFWDPSLDNAGKADFEYAIGGGWRFDLTHRDGERYVPTMVITHEQTFVSTRNGTFAVDSPLAEAIRRLNEAGYRTGHSCQGEDRLAAYISFEGDAPIDLLRCISKMGGTIETIEAFDATSRRTKRKTVLRSAERCERHDDYVRRNLTFQAILEAWRP